MTKVSLRPISSQEEERFLDDFWSAVTSLKDKKETRNFLTEILTPTERMMIAKRFQIVMMLLLEYDYQEIKNRVKVTNETIAKMSNLLKEKREAVKKVAREIVKLKIKKMESWQRKGRRRSKTLGSVLVETAAKELGKAALSEAAKHRKQTSISR